MWDPKILLCSNNQTQETVCPSTATYLRSHVGRASPSACTSYLWIFWIEQPPTFFVKLFPLQKKPKNQNKHLLRCTFHVRFQTICKKIDFQTVHPWNPKKKSNLKRRLRRPPSVPRYRGSIPWLFAWSSSHNGCRSQISTDRRLGKEPKKVRSFTKKFCYLIMGCLPPSPRNFPCCWSWHLAGLIRFANLLSSLILIYYGVSVTFIQNLSKHNPLGVFSNLRVLETCAGFTLWEPSRDGELHEILSHKTRNEQWKSLV